jgi:tetratricopeptide (TPR) repeat protein
MFARKPISPESVPGALAKAERYRLLNEPTEAESICRDILELDPDNQPALIQLILALTDQIPDESRAFGEALELTQSLRSAYDRAYYAGICWERRAKGRHQRGGHGSHQYAYEWLIKALEFFEEAERLRAPGNDDAVLRWNACVRYLARHKELAPRPEEQPEPIGSE